jgi:hypothetical protein
MEIYCPARSIVATSTVPVARSVTGGNVTYLKKPTLNSVYGIQRFRLRSLRINPSTHSGQYINHMFHIKKAVNFPSRFLCECPTILRTNIGYFAAQHFRSTFIMETHYSAAFGQ